MSCTVKDNGELDYSFTDDSNYLNGGILIEIVTTNQTIVDETVENFNEGKSEGADRFDYLCNWNAITEVDRPFIKEVIEVMTHQLAIKTSVQNRMSI